MINTKRLTWSTPDGCWGVHGVELETLPTKIYAALNKLKEMEAIVEHLNDPSIENFEAEALMLALMDMAPFEADPDGVVFCEGRRYVAC